MTITPSPCPPKGEAQTQGSRGESLILECAVDAFGQVSHHREQGMNFYFSHLTAPASPLEMSSSGYSQWGALSPDLY